MSGRPTVKRRDVLAASGAGLVMLAAPSIVRAQATTLRLPNWYPQTSLIPENVLTPFVEEVARITEGRVQIDVTPPTAPPEAIYQMIQAGETDIGFSLHGYSGDDAFPRAKIGQFSFLGDAFSASHAFSKVYGQLLDAAEEHEGVRLLSVFQHGPGALMLKDRTIAGPDDFRGLRVRTSGGYISGLLADLGIEPTLMSPLEVPEALATGRIDGVAFPYETADVLQMPRFVSFISEVPGGYYNGTFFLAMSENAAEQIGPEDFATIQRWARETVHVLAAKAFDYADYIAKEKFVANGTPIEVADAATLDFIRSYANRYEAAWTETLAQSGYDGERALAYTRRITSGG